MARIQLPFTYQPKRGSNEASRDVQAKPAERGKAAKADLAKPAANKSSRRPAGITPDADAELARIRALNAARQKRYRATVKAREK